MPSTLPTGRRGQVMALLITFVPLLALWSVAVVPLTDLYGERAEQLTARRRLVQRMSLLAADLPALQDRAAAMAKSDGPVVRLLDGTSDALAAASLQNRVQEMVVAAGARLTSVEIMETTAAGDYRRIGLKVALSAPWPVLVGLLGGVEQSSLPMMIDGLQIRAGSAASSSGGSGSDGARSFDAGFTVSAFRSAAAAAADGPGKAP
ncbi:type II secretion system protein GspM [Telmatospirillum siberiense]|uniref:General secretion pathway protein GspM n=1 Tax=Telmatospirillum siberiense TaxID=382514 RepID=A0A2N3PQB1_9PROT|nr:type II secretion system protein GspM [Telmatospirillum siberiense]PKU22591.1 hypothetical protein CWS72_20580 [Telmatospirillum siberiense]